MSESILGQIGDIVSRFTNELIKKGQHNNSTSDYFNWRGLGFQVGCCFIAVPLHNFLSGILQYVHRTSVLWGDRSPNAHQELNYDLTGPPTEPEEADPLETLIVVAQQSNQVRKADWQKGYWFIGCTQAKLNVRFWWIWWCRRSWKDFHRVFPKHTVGYWMPVVTSSQSRLYCVWLHH